MAERKSVNKYYPPDWDPSKGSVNKYVGQHPLRDRAKKLSQGILVIRFEMPYNIWCGGCNSHIGMGVRYNAEKTKTGMYYTTPIYKFRMKCHLCPNYFEIQTDPKNHDYVILEGARRKEQRWDPKENEQIVPEDRATHKKMATDAMFKLEHGSDDVKKGKAIVMTLSNLEGRRDGWKDDYILNKIARQKFRNEKKTLKSVADSDAALLSKSSLEIPLVEEKEQDKKLAHLMKYRTVQSFDEKQAQKRKEIESKPIFQPSKAQKLDSSPTKNKKLVIVKKHFLSIGNKKTCPFNSNRLKNHSKSSLDKVSLGIKRKSSRNDTAKEENVETNTNLREVEANSIVMGMNVTDSVIDDCETESPDDMIDRNVSHSELDIGNDMSNLENNAAHTDEIEINVNGSEKSRASANEDLESDVCHSVVETDVLQKCSNVIKGPVKDEMNSDIKLENIAHQNFQNLKHQIAKEIKAYSGDPTSSYKYNCADISETSMSHSKEKLQLVSSDETLEEKHFKSKYTCDSKDNSSMTESGEAVSDITPRCDLENEIYKAGKEKDTEREIEVNPILETKIDRKSLSLVAIYSDSETDNSDSS